MTTTRTRPRIPRDPATGLASEHDVLAAGDGDGFGDGRTPVDLTVEHVGYASALHACVWVVPSRSSAPRDGGGRPMTGWVTQRAGERVSLPADALQDPTSPGVSAAVDQLIAWAKGYGVHEDVVRGRATAALVHAARATVNRTAREVYTTLLDAPVFVPMQTLERILAGQRTPELYGPTRRRVEQLLAPLPALLHTQVIAQVRHINDTEGWGR